MFTQGIDMEHKTTCSNPECKATWYRKVEANICPLCGQLTLIHREANQNGIKKDTACSQIQKGKD